MQQSAPPEGWCFRYQGWGRRLTDLSEGRRLRPWPKSSDWGLFTGSLMVQHLPPNKLASGESYWGRDQSRVKRAKAIGELEVVRDLLVDSLVAVVLAVCCGYFVVVRFRECTGWSLQSEWNCDEITGCLRYMDFTSPRIGSSVALFVITCGEPGHGITPLANASI